MPASRIFPTVMLLGFLTVLAFPMPALAAGPLYGACLNKAEQSAAVASHRAVPLAAAIKSLRTHGRRAEVVSARLCRRGNGLVYELTLLARSGRVTRATIDAASGALINGR
jgi:hypothetical protein